MNVNNRNVTEKHTNTKTHIILYVDSFRLEFETVIDAIDFIRTYTNTYQQEIKI